MSSAENSPDQHLEIPPELAEVVPPIEGIISEAELYWEQTFDRIKTFNGVDASTVWGRGSRPGPKHIKSDNFSAVQFVVSLRDSISLACTRAEVGEKFARLAPKYLSTGVAVLASEVADSYNQACFPNSPPGSLDEISGITQPFAQALLLRQAAFDKSCDLFDNPAYAIPLVDFLEAAAAQKPDSQDRDGKGLVRLMGTHTNNAQDYTNVILRAMRRDAPAALDLADEYLAAGLQPNTSVPYSDNLRMAFRLLHLHSQLFARGVEVQDPAEAEARHRAWLIQQYDDWPPGLVKALENYTKLKFNNRWAGLKENLRKHSEPAKRLYRNTALISGND